jgi:hypothetical protein
MCSRPFRGGASWAGVGMLPRSCLSERTTYLAAATGDILGGPISNGKTVLPPTFADAQRERRILQTAANTTTQNEPAAQLLCLWGWQLWTIAAYIILQPLSPEGHDTVTQHSSHSQAHCYWLCIGSCNAAHAQSMKRRQILTVEQYLRVSVFICLLRSVL